MRNEKEYKSEQKKWKVSNEDIKKTKICLKVDIYRRQKTVNKWKRKTLIFLDSTVVSRNLCQEFLWFLQLISILWRWKRKNLEKTLARKKVDNDNVESTYDDNIIQLLFP